MVGAGGNGQHIVVRVPGLGGVEYTVNQVEDIMRGKPNPFLIEERSQFAEVKHPFSATLTMLRTLPSCCNTAAGRRRVMSHTNTHAGMLSGEQNRQGEYCTVLVTRQKRRGEEISEFHKLAIYS